MGLWNSAKSMSERIGRRKEFAGEDEVLDTRLKRCLSTLDITLLGIGHMMGSGIYVISPQAAQVAGPACIISFLIAGIASLLAALAYAEFGVRFPRAGSAYSYVYFSLGEFIAFIVGWNVILENGLALSVVVQSCGNYIDSSLTNGNISAFIAENIGTLTEDKDSIFNEVPHLLVIVLMVFYVIASMLGTHETTLIGNILCGANVAMLLMIVGIGVWKGSLSNWENSSTGGFLPNGWPGVFQAASMCFFSYGGFDAISATGEEAKNPKKSMPIATIVSMMTVASLYMAVAACLTLLRNWKDIDVLNGFPEAMEYNGVIWAKILITIGALCGMTTVIIVTLYTIVRAAYSMAEDGLLPPFFAKITQGKQIPLYSMFVFAALATVIAVFIQVPVIIDMLSIGTLMAYMMVTCGLVTHRYAGTEDRPLSMRYFRFLEKTLRNVFTQRTYIYTLLALIIGFSFSLSNFIKGTVHDPTYISQIFLALYLVGLTACLFILQEVEEHNDNYKMPLMPWLAVLSIFINCFLMNALGGITWLRLLIWISVGSAIYFGYGIRHSRFEQRRCVSTCQVSTENVPRIQY